MPRQAYFTGNLSWHCVIYYYDNKPPTGFNVSFPVFNRSEHGWIEYKK
jgi:hypothetical protein